MAHTRDEEIREITLDYLNKINIQNPPSPAKIQEELLDAISASFQAQNTMRPKGDKWKIPDRLLTEQVAMVILHLHPVVNIVCLESNATQDYDLLGLYQNSGPDVGIYVTEESAFRKLIRKYCFAATTSEIKDITRMLKEDAPRKSRCKEKNLVAVNNGIFDYDAKRLLPFSEEKVFTAKSRVDYNPNAANVVIHNDDDDTDWDVESWMEDLFDDPELTRLAWELLGAVIRPNVRWNKSAWFFSNTGNNGKGTLCSLMRNLCGDGTHTSIPLSDFGKDFALEPLIRSSAIIVDENDVGTFIDKAANLKAVITGDVIQINRKFKTPIAYQFRGFMVQCLNEMPRFKDKTDSFYRRQLFVPFHKSFTGRERMYIKDDYLRRREVLEYVLFKVLNLDYYELSNPKACREALQDYKLYNDPVRQFVEEMLPQCAWDLLPYAFLYALYKAWLRKNSPSSQPQGRNSFINDLKMIISTGNHGWEIKEDVRVGSKMDKPEALLMLYGLAEWHAPTDPKKAYDGLVRI